MKGGSQMRNEILSALAKQGMTRDEFAKKIGISYTSFTTKLNGKVTFKLSEAKKICEALQLPPSIFFD